MNWIRYISIVILATFKTLVTPPVAFAADLSFVETMICVTVGGIIGFVLPFLFIDFIFRKINGTASAGKLAKRIGRLRKIIMMRQRYPVWIFIMLLPLMSVPVMAYVVRKLFGSDKKTFLYSLAVVVVWSIGMCIVSSPIMML